jgi:hypothetical protein
MIINDTSELCHNLEHRLGSKLMAVAKATEKAIVKALLVNVNIQSA